MKKLAKWLLIIAIFFLLLWTMVTAGGCGKMMEGTGHIFEGIGQGAAAIGEHLVDVVDKGQ